MLQGHHAVKLVGKQAKIKWLGRKGYVGKLVVKFRIDRQALAYSRSAFWPLICAFRMRKRHIEEAYQQDKKGGFVATLALTGRTSRRQTEEEALAAVDHVLNALDTILKAQKGGGEQ